VYGFLEREEKTITNNTSPQQYITTTIHDHRIHHHSNTSPQQNIATTIHHHNTTK
jgi:hypothetical protein